MSRLEYEGRFLADVDDYGIFQASTSKAVAIDIWFTTVSYFGPQGEAPYEGYRTRGRFFVIGRSGDVLPDQVTALSDAFEWDGDLSVIQAKAWEPRWVQVVVKKETTDNGKEFFNVAWVMRPDWKPAKAGNVDGSQGRQIAQRYTSALQSLVRKHRRQKGEQPAPASPASREQSPPPSQAEPPDSEDVTWDQETAWNRFLSRSEGMDEKTTETVWEEAVHHFGGAKDSSEMTPEEWQAVAEIDPHSWTPF